MWLGRHWLSGWQRQALLVGDQHHTGALFHGLGEFSQLRFRVSLLSDILADADKTDDLSLSVVREDVVPGQQTGLTITGLPIVAAREAGADPSMAGTGRRERSS